MKIFGNFDNKNVELVSRKMLENGQIKTLFKFGKLTVTGVSNKPSNESINKLADNMSKIAESILR
ncbi:acyl-CoA thioester hydrolase [Neobacillus sp. MER 74]|uniref:acyl-CoA thioester hydrolase n=1 Tax=Neobacillus sp. MER 74 TaxID=2939566 RepID=UPI00203CFDAD|nr:acyl-CoA thioester hydrolase [Neobacillus sp. MER 74]MCM3115472.1 acyl-CoA thioester hydrolase [Neobacillus sp. MER 74]